MAEDRQWARLNVAWALYFVAVFTLGRDSRYMQPIIWGGGLLVGLPTLRSIVAAGLRPSRAAAFLWLFAAWTLLGVVVASDDASFWSYFALVVERAALITLVSISIQQSRGLRVWYVAFAVVGVVSGAGEGLLDTATAVTSGLAVERQSGLTGNPNELGLLAFLGLFGGLVLAGAEGRRVWAVALALAATVLSAYGVLLSASRSALLAAAISLAGWPLVVGRRGLKSRWLMAAVVLLAWLALESHVGTLFQSSTMGKRMSAVEESTDHSSDVRLELAKRGLELAAESPILGVGLGQFGVASGTGFYAHSEWVELLATTGGPGVFLYIAALVVVGRQLWAGARKGASEDHGYFARASLLGVAVILLTGMVSWPHFISPHSMFLVGVIFGTAAMVDRPKAGPFAFRRRARRPAAPRGASA